MPSRFVAIDPGDPNIGYAIVHGDNIDWSPETEAAINALILAAYAQLKDTDDADTTED